MITESEEKILDKLHQLDTKINECISSNQAQTVKLEELRLTQNAHAKTILEMTNTFLQARGIMWFLKIMGSIATLAYGAYEILRNFITVKFGG